MIFAPEFPEQLLSQFNCAEELHPITFRDGWGLSNTVAAFYLGISETALKSYAYREGSHGRRKPSATLMRLTAMIHQKWLDMGHKPKYPKFFQQ